MRALTGHHHCEWARRAQCTHQTGQHTCVDTHLSSGVPSAGSALPGQQAGGWTGLGKEAESSLNPWPLSTSACPSKWLLPALPTLLAPYSQSRVAGRAETSFPRCRLVRVVECFRELPAGTEEGSQFPLGTCHWGFQTDPRGSDLPKFMPESPPVPHSTHLGTQVHCCSPGLVMFSAHKTKSCVQGAHRPEHQT